MITRRHAGNIVSARGNSLRTVIFRAENTKKKKDRRVKRRMEFENMPEIPEEELRRVREEFPDYLFFTNQKRGERAWRCTACGERYRTGGLRKTETPEDRELIYARMGERRRCAKCGKLCTVKSALRTNPGRLYEARYIVFVIPKGRNEVWLRCITAHMDYAANDGFGFCEELRCRLVPGEARQWESSYYKGWNERETFAEPFRYNYGLYCEKHPYTLRACGGGIEKTFLKYSAVELFASRHYDVPWVKYLCRYAEIPALEMVVKLGLQSIADALVYENLPNKRVIDWEARKPWNLVRLERNVFKVWFDESKELGVLKLNRALRGKSEKDMRAAMRLYDYSYNLKEARTAAAVIGTAAEVARLIKYIEKTAAESGGGCRCCPGITEREAFNLWLDFADMAKRMKLEGKINPFPKDLKAAHDALARTCEIKDMKARAAEAHKTAAAEAVKREKEFPRVGKIYKRIRKKFEFESGGFRIAVPEKIEDILFEGTMLNTCLSRTGRYFERIQDNESYLFFLRKTDEPDMPWYTIEAEPGGTIRQKRTVNDCQNSDLKEAEGFLREWQEHIKRTMTRADKRSAAKSREARIREFAELREKSIRVNYGVHAGQLLADILERDLME